ncbi:unnamed protein product [Darwinula stevensoni]|uniref:Uncharacterized protein n=1 Tax=Darwinula stevensoni TaxID=69355 RepID=A0A7R9AI10_9CRUS|nr:unnamed protein product [Darwinula stevensoni]CAG0905676.1 unnamed protein product [Darwinula stevensoni]
MCPQWGTILGCMCCRPQEELDSMLLEEFLGNREKIRANTHAPRDSTIVLTTHQTLYPPGRIIHIVRRHPTDEE